MNTVIVIALLAALATVIYTFLEILGEGYRAMLRRKEVEIRRDLWHGRISLPESCVQIFRLHGNRPWYVKLNNRLRAIFN